MENRLFRLKGPWPSGIGFRKRWKLLSLCAVMLVATTALFATITLRTATHAATRTTKTTQAASTVVQAAGFDTCTTPTVSQMAAWWGSSPYRWANIYIGGETVCNTGPNLNASWVSTVLQQGWDLLPTWVGLQAPCNTHGYSSMSSDSATSFEQGKSDADAAIATATNLGLGSGSVIYDDIEQFDSSNGGCAAAVNAFINGWDREITGRGYTSGLYESASNLSSVANAGISEPTAIWIAGGGFWSGSYSSGCTVFGNQYVSDGLWSNHQRVHQYTNGHNETYNGVTLKVDSDCSDGPLVSSSALPPVGRSPSNSPVASWGANRLDIFGVGKDQVMYHKNWNGYGWSPDWENLEGGFISAPTVVSWGTNRLDIFGIGADHAMYHKNWNGYGWSTDWENLGGSFTSLSPSVVSWQANRLDIFAIGTDGTMQHKNWNGYGWSPGWENLGGGFSAL